MEELHEEQNQPVSAPAVPLDAETPSSEQPMGKRRKILPYVNFRPLLFCALGLASGIFLYTRIRFGGLAASDFIFPVLLLFVGIQPFKRKRILAVLLCFLVSAGVGVASIHIYSQQFVSGMDAGEYEVSGTVQSVSEGSFSTSVTLSSLTIDGERAGGKMLVNVSSGEIRTGDVVSFTGKISRSELPASGNSYSEYLFESDVRYVASASVLEITGSASNPFLLLNAAVYDKLHSNMTRDEADVAYALMTGQSGAVDGTLLDSIREGGIAHIFAVSGLHIGILFVAVSLIFTPLLKRKAFLPALAAAVLYCAFCGFTVSSLRAVIMCAVLSVNKFFGRKTDFLNSISFATIIVLTFMPAEWLSSGFRLSFGACLGLALFSPSFQRLFRRLPSFLGKYLAACLSVQIFTFPVLLESFGYFSVWGMLLNFFLIPLLPVLFLGLLVCTLLALVIAPAAAFFLIFPQSMLSVLTYVFSVCDFSLVLTGFTLGSGAIVWIAGTVFLSQRFRMKAVVRAVAAGFICVLFAICMIYENAVFYGCKIVVYEDGSAGAALIRTNSSAVLVIDGDATLKKCKSFLARTYGGQLDGVVVLCRDEMDGINVGAFLPTDGVYAREEIETGLRVTSVTFGEKFTVGGISFRYESADKLTALAEGSVVEIDFENEGELGADLFIGKGSGNLKFFLKDGIIRAI